MSSKSPYFALLISLSFLAMPACAPKKADKPKIAAAQTQGDKKNEKKSDGKTEKKSDKNSDKKSGKKTVAKAPSTSKPPQTKTPVAKTPAKKPATKTPVKKTPIKKNPAKKDPVAKTPAKKPADKKAPQKPSDKKPQPKKPEPKKPVDKKQPQKPGDKQPPKQADQDNPCQGKKPGEILENKFIKVAEKASMMMTAGMLGAEPKHDVKIYKVIYCTPNVREGLIKASGALMLPVRADVKKPEQNSPVEANLPLLIYQHGTTRQKANVPSNPDTLDSQGVSAGLVSQGFAAIAPDYIGLGDSPGIHPYLHADTQSTSAIALMMAAAKIAETEKTNLSGDLYITGYSQGGHAAMALHRDLESKPSDSFKIIASTPMAGPYDMSNISLVAAYKEPSPNTPFYAFNLVVGMYHTYGILDQLDQAIKKEYLDKVLPKLLEGKVKDEFYAENLPKTLQELFTAKMMDALMSQDKGHPFMQALEKNSILDWAPKAPMKLMHAKGDKDVAFENSVKAYESMKKLGAKNVELINLGNHSHTNAIIPGFSKTVKWFVQLKNERSKNVVADAGRDATATVDMTPKEAGFASANTTLREGYELHPTKQ